MPLLIFECCFCNGNPGVNITRTRTYKHTFIDTYIHIHTYIHTHTHTYIHAYNNPTVFDIHISSHVYHVLIWAYSVNRTAHTFRKMGSDGLACTVQVKNITQAFYTCSVALNAKPLVTSGLQLSKSNHFHEFPIFLPGPTVNTSLAVLYVLRPWLLKMQDLLLVVGTQQ